MPAFNDLTGQKFGRLTVVRRIGQDRGGNIKWDCSCDCGGQKITRTDHLTTGRTVSCGCARPNEIEIPASLRYARMKGTSKVRGLSFELSLSQFDDLTGQPCRYCGGMPGSHNGIDRVDSSVGYVYHNCVPCCWVCNSAKNNMSVVDFRAWVKRVYWHLEEAENASRTS